ncbi:MAG: transcription termination/antitermination protein NusA, partial [Flavobacteriales bacterium]|nr:transcription termination/antitermination protein NusA [Flavobacteriales bacterium]
VFRGVVKRKYGEDANFDIIINPDKGDLEIWLNREIVPDGEVEDPGKQIALSDALKVEPDFEVGEEVSQEVKIADFGRRSILSLKQNLQGRIMELERDHIYSKYKERVGEIITGEVYQIWKRETLVLDDEGNELIMPKDQHIKTDFFKKGDTVRAVVWKVEMRNNSPVVLLSRTAPEFLEKLFEQEVPEVADGLITIKRIVREPGERAKVAVESYDDRIDPVGACVGMKGSRIHGIVRELRNENIDVINFTTNDQLLIQRALSPAKVGEIKLDEANKRAEVYMKPDQVALAIGKGGHNIKLAGRLSGYDIDVYRDSDEVTDDVDLDEFKDEIEPWIIDTLKNIGCDTARSVVEIAPDELAKRTDLEDETVLEVLRILKLELSK